MMDATFPDAGGLRAGSLARRVTRALGWIGLALGVAAAFVGPLEFYCFYLFVPERDFYYEGFGFGSFVFGLIACQILGYYLLAGLLVPLGWGHLRHRPWTPALVRTLLWCWLIVGLPVSLFGLFSVLAIKTFPDGLAWALILLTAAAYLVLPWGLLRIYGSAPVRAVFQRQDGSPTWLERRPVRLLVPAFLAAFYAIAFHVPLFFHGVFPLFGRLIAGLPGCMAWAALIVLGAGLAAGFLLQPAWAVRGGVLLFGFLAATFVVTFLPLDYPVLLAALNLPPREYQVLAALPVAGWHLAALTGVPFALTLAAMANARRAATHAADLPVMD